LNFFCRNIDKLTKITKNIEKKITSRLVFIFHLFWFVRVCVM